MDGTNGTYGERYTERIGGNVEEKRALEDLGLDGRIMFKLIFKEWDWGYGLD
jgi:hypothetical protein